MKLEDFAITESKLDSKSVSGAKIKDLTITGSNIADTTLPGDKLENYTLSDTQVRGGGLSTWSTSDGIDRSLGFAEFSNSAFFSDAPVDYINTKYLKVGSGATFSSVGASTLYVGGYLAAWGQPSVSLSAQFAFKATDQGGNERWVNAYASTASVSNYCLVYGG